MCIVKIYTNLKIFVNMYKRVRGRTCPITVLTLYSKLTMAVVSLLGSVRYIQNNNNNNNIYHSSSAPIYNTVIHPYIGDCLTLTPVIAGL